jgi:hypothetical protein
MLPLCCGLCLYLLGMLCCSFRQGAVGFTPFTDTIPFHIDILPATATTPLKLSISAANKTTTNIRIEWQVLLNGLPGQKGVFPTVALLPHHPALLRLPVKLPPAGEEAWVRVTCRHAQTAFVQLLPLSPWHGDATIPPTGELTFNDSNNIFTVTAAGTSIGFDKQTGWLLHYEAGHTLLMGDTAGVQPALWPGIPPRLQLFSTSTGPQLVIVRAEYTLPETVSLLHLSYTINATGEMLVTQVLEADTGQHLPDSVHLPALPGFGMRWLLPPRLDSITWFGAPDSPAALQATPAAAAPTITHRALTTGTTTRATRWMTITGPDGTGLRITADSTLLETGTAAFTDTLTHAVRVQLQLKNPSDSIHHFLYKLAPVPAKPI